MGPADDENMLLPLAQTGRPEVGQADMAMELHRRQVGQQVVGFLVTVIENMAQ